MANVHIVLQGNLSSILYQVSSAYIVSLYTNKHLSVDTDLIDKSSISILNNIEKKRDVHCKNSFFFSNVLSSDLCSYIPKCKNDLEMIGSFKNKNFLMSYRKQLINLFVLNELKELDNSIYIYIDNGMIKYYDEFVNYILKNTDYHIVLVLEGEQEVAIEQSQRIQIVRDADNYTKLSIMVNCKKGGYYKGDELGWWGSFLNPYETSILTEELSKRKIKLTEELCKINDISEPPVFIALPTYNRGNKCISVIQQILNQTYQKWKLCVIDDGSREEESDIIKNKVYQLDDHRIVYLKNEQNMKLVKTLNRGLEIFLGENYSFFTWISDDNEYFPNFIRSLVVKEKDFIYTRHSVKSFNEIKEIRGEYRTVKDILDKFKGLGSFMWSKKAIKRIGFYNFGITLLEDYDYLIRTFLHLAPEEIEYQNVLGMEYDCHEDTLYLKNLEYIKEKHTELVMFYRKIDFKKPLFLYYTTSDTDLQFMSFHTFMNHEYNKVVIRNNRKIEYDSENDIIYLGKNNIDLVLNLFDLISDKVIIYNDIEIISNAGAKRIIENYPYEEQIDGVYSKQIFRLGSLCYLNKILNK